MWRTLIISTMCGCCDAIQNGTIYKIFYKDVYKDILQTKCFLRTTIQRIFYSCLIPATLVISLHASVNVNVNKFVYSSHSPCTFPIAKSWSSILKYVTAFSVRHSAGQSATKLYSLVIFFRLISHEWEHIIRQLLVLWHKHQHSLSPLHPSATTANSSYSWLWITSNPIQHTLTVHKKKHKKKTNG